MLFAFGTEFSTCSCIELISITFTDDFDQFSLNNFIVHNKINLVILWKYTHVYL
jgi:hypothetical protein